MELMNNSVNSENLTRQAAKAEEIYNETDLGTYTRPLPPLWIILLVLVACVLAGKFSGYSVSMIVFIGCIIIIGILLYRGFSKLVIHQTNLRIVINGSRTILYRNVKSMRAINNTLYIDTTSHQYRWKGIPDADTIVNNYKKVMGQH